MGSSIPFFDVLLFTKDSPAACARGQDLLYIIRLGPLFDLDNLESQQWVFFWIWHTTRGGSISRLRPNFGLALEPPVLGGK